MRRGVKSGFATFLSTSLCIYLLVFPQPAWAVQAHGGAEGLISHQVGHILFFSGMLALLIRLLRRKLSGPGWNHLKLFLCLIIFWNGLTFSGHWMHEMVDMGKFVKGNGHTTGFMAQTPFDFFFYLTRLDHVVLVPAFFFLLQAFRQWDKTS